MENPTNSSNAFISTQLCLWVYERWWWWKKAVAVAVAAIATWNAFYTQKKRTHACRQCRLETWVRPSTQHRVDNEEKIAAQRIVPTMIINFISKKWSNIISYIDFSSLYRIRTHIACTSFGIRLWIEYIHTIGTHTHASEQQQQQQHSTIADIGLVRSIVCTVCATRIWSVCAML